MELGSVKVKKKSKDQGPLKSSPGFLKCMRSVYLYFKEEKEKGALNIPINSFIERTAVACGVGRKTLYNYAKKGLFNEQPTLLQSKKKKKKKLKVVSTCNGKDKSRCRSIQVQTDTPNYCSFANTTILNSLTQVDDENGLTNKDGKDTIGVCKVGATLNPPVEVAWSAGTASRRDIEYFTKSPAWQNVQHVYSINTSDITSLSVSRIENLPSNSTADLTNL